MVQYAASDIAEVVFIEEAAFGTQPIAGAWLQFGNPTGFGFEPQYTVHRKRGLGHQKPTAFKKIKEFWRGRVDFDVLVKDTSPVYNWSAILDMIINKTGANIPADQGNFMSMGAKIDIATDEFYALNGGKLDSLTVGGSAVDDVIKASIEGIFQSGDYSETDYVTGTATRTAEIDSATVAYGDCDVLWGVDASEATILSRLNSWSWNFTRAHRMRGTLAGATTKYREFVGVQQDITASLNIDFDSKTELEYLIDQTGFSLILKVPTGTGGVQIDCDGGKFVSGQLPVRELDLLGVTLNAEFTQVTVTDIA